MPLKPETLEQIKLFNWIRANPLLSKCAIHIPNEGQRSKVMGYTLKLMGMRAGVSDVFIAYPTKTMAGLWLELKAKNARGKYGKPTENQVKFIADMAAMGYMAKVCNGTEEAITVIKNYLIT
jgi:hypothetical protein